MSPKLALPTTVADVDAAWLARALGREVRSAQIVDVITGTSTKIRVRLDTRDTLPDTLIVKGGFESHSPSMGPMYANEAFFYREVQPYIPIRSPRCWFAASDRGSYQSIVIMEDLAAAGVTFLQAQRPLGFEDVARRLRAMARFHAASWDAPEFAQGGRWDTIGSRFDDWSLVYQRRYLVPEVWRHYVESPRGAAVSTRLHDAAWMERALARLGEIERSGPVCLIHGDTHLGNLYVERDGEPGFFDAQVARASPLLEVSYHVTCALDLADQARFERELLGVYLDGLAAEGVQPPGPEEAWLRYRQYIAYGYFIFLINEVRFQTESVNTAYSARFGAALIRHDVVGLLS